MTERYWTIVFPGECGQHVQETWSEKQILSSAWYKNWVMKVIEDRRVELLEDNQTAIDDWITVHWAIETNEFGRDLLNKS
jgi:hypothetical protein